MLLSTNPVSPCFGSLVTNVRFPYWLGWVGMMLEGWQKDQCHVNKSQHASCQVLTSLPSINRWSKGQNSICSSAYPRWQSRIQASVYLSGSMFISPHGPFFNISIFQGGGVHGFSFLCSLMLGWHEDN